MGGRRKQGPGEKVFYVELSDVLKPVGPLGKGSPVDEWREKAQSTRGDSFVWAVCGRPVPLVGRDAGRQVASEDDMGGARVVQSVKAILSTGYKGQSDLFKAGYRADEQVHSCTRCLKRSAWRSMTPSSPIYTPKLARSPLNC